MRQADPLPAGLDKIVWQAGGHVYWFGMTEPTLQKVRNGIDSILERGHGYRALVGVTKQGTGLLHEDPEQPLISKNTSLRPVRPVRQTHLMQNVNRESGRTGAHLKLRTLRAHT